jgi:UDP-N-acetylmuramyl tripeptide synthase
MRIVDARRLRGPSLGTSGPGAIVEIALERGERAADVVARVRRAWAAIVRALGRRGAPLSRKLVSRSWRGGLAVFVAAPIDRLMPALDALEAAVGVAIGTERVDDVVPRLARALDDASRPALVRLADAASRRGLPILADDDAVTIGSGTGARTYALGAIPRSIPWRSIRSIPIALVTGTNGKTTTTRMVARIAKHAGLVPGNTSSDGTAIDEVIVDPGDNTGGESARAVLRDPRVQIAILETARGGLLRRGLAVTAVDAALITNVTPDHLGEHGVLDLETLVRTKAVVAHAVRRGGIVVLGADDPSLVRLGRTLRGRNRVWFALAPFASRDTVLAIVDGWITRIHRAARTPIVRVDEIPITDGGRALHNAKNALAAAALAFALGLPDAAIASGLRSFRTSDNPGRGKVETTPSGVRVVLDFGHNPAAARDLYAWARALAGAHAVHAVITQPGDRDDRAMTSFAKAAVVAAKVRSATVWEAEHLRRGRASGAITKTLVRALRAAHVRTVRVAASEADAVARAVAAARPGDVVVVSPSLDRGVPT